MNRNFIRALFAVAVAMLSAAGCDSTSSVLTDEPVPVDTVIPPGVDDTISAPDPEGEFQPYTGPIEPLTDYVRPTITEGKRWMREKYHYIYGVDIDTTIVTIDTILMGRKGKAICYPLAARDGYYACQDVMSEENGRVYYFKACSSEWHMIFDVNAQFADSVSARSCVVYPLSRGTITLMGRTRRAVKVWCPYDSRRRYVWWWENPYYNYDYWVEGIGMLYGHFPETYDAVSGSRPHYLYHRLRECWDGDDKIYDYREFKDELYQPTEIFADISDWPYWQKPESEE